MLENIENELHGGKAYSELTDLSFVKEWNVARRDVQQSTATPDLIRPSPLLSKQNVDYDLNGKTDEGCQTRSFSLSEKEHLTQYISRST